VIETNINTDGLMILGAKVTALGGRQYHYEYALQNQNSYRGAKSFSMPIPPSATVTNVGFHDVDYHSGEPFDGTDWTSQITPHRRDLGHPGLRGQPERQRAALGDALQLPLRLQHAARHLFDHGGDVPAGIAGLLHGQHAHPRDLRLRAQRDRL
jgi:hypothetical protein